jgi:hypothetical protein
MSTQEQPSRRLADEDGADDQQTGGDELHGEGDEPLLVARGEGLVDTVLPFISISNNGEARDSR